MPCFFRYANIDDAETIAVINSKSALEGYKGIIPDDVLREKFSEERLKERLIKELSEGSTSSCILYMDDIPVGMQTFAKDNGRERDSSEIEIWRIYLLPEYWGQKLGKQFMDWGIMELGKSGYKKVALWVVEENQRARKFYESYGFKFDGEVMVLNLGREIKQLRYTIDI